MGKREREEAEQHILQLVEKTSEVGGLHLGSDLVSRVTESLLMGNRYFKSAAHTKSKDRNRGKS